MIPPHLLHSIMRYVSRKPGFNPRSTLTKNPIYSTWYLLTYYTALWDTYQGNRGSIPGRLFPKTQIIVLDTSSLITSIMRYVSRKPGFNPRSTLTKNPNYSTWYLLTYYTALWDTYQGNRGSIPGRLLPKTEIIVLDTSSLITQHYEIRIKETGVQSQVDSYQKPKL